MLWKELPDELPVEKLSLLLDIWRGNPVDTVDATLAVLNVVGYAARRGLVKPMAAFNEAPAMMAPVTSSAAEVEAAFAEVMTMQAGPASAAGTASQHGQPSATPVAAMVAFDATKKIPWQTILSVAIPILRKLILGF